MGNGIMAIGFLLGSSSIAYLFLIGLFSFGWFRGKKKRTVAGSTGKHKVSVIIAARNEGKCIGDLLNDLLIQEYDGELMEIIVVDDHSADNTGKIVNDFMVSDRKRRVTLLKNENHGCSGKKGALALGITQAAGTIILTTDADCRIGPGWVSSLSSGFQNEKIKMAFGPVGYFTGKRLSDKFQSLEFSGLAGSGAGAALAGHPFICSGANLAYRKDAFLQVKGFEGNEKYISGDDVFLMHKMKIEFGNESIIFSRDKRSTVMTSPANGIRAFLKQRIRWASKTVGYIDKLAIITAISVFIFNFFLCASFFTGLFNPEAFLLSAAFLFVKILADLPLLWGITGFTGNRPLLRWYLPFQLVYPFYIVVAGVGSLFGKKLW